MKSRVNEIWKVAGLLVCAAAWIAPGAAAFVPLFDTRLDYRTGAYPVSVCVADFDGDGRLDLATANEGGNSVSVLRNNGDGTFRDAVNYPAGRNPNGVCAADLDGDGRIDLAVAAWSSNTVVVLKGNGDGTFQPYVSYGVGLHPSSVCAADFDHDGAPDLAVANYDSNSVSVLRNNGDGTFGLSVSYATGMGPISVACGDFEHDGRIDLAVVNHLSETVTVLINQRHCVFGDAVDYPTGQAPESVCAADLDGDGYLDLAVAEWWVGEIGILKNNGDRTFAAAVHYGVHGSAYYMPQSICAADLDGDGRLDLATATWDLDKMSVWKNNSDGTFSRAADYWTSSQPWAICATDFEGDGNMDLAVANYYGVNVSVFKNKGDGTFPAAPEYGLGLGTIAWSICAADFNANGKQDLVIANRGSNTLSMYRNNGGATFQGPFNYPSKGNPVAVCAADLEGDDDGRPDVAVACWDSNCVRIYDSWGNAQLTYSGRVGVGTHPTAVCAGDFDNDGKVDLAVTNEYDWTVSILKNLGGGVFQPRVDCAVGHSPSSVCSADLNGDGKLDLAVANKGSNTVSILRNNGDGSFAASVSYQVGPGPISITAADLGGDGDIDLAVANNQMGGSVTVLKNDGHGGFAGRTDYRAGNFAMAICSADFDGDGKIDLAVAGTADNDVLILRNTGSGHYESAGTYGVGDFATALCSADLDGNGTPDLAVVFAYGSGEISISAMSILMSTSEPIATLLRSFEAALAGNSILLSWALSEMDQGARFSILRASGPTWSFEEIENAAVASEGLSFEFTDATILPGSSYKYRVDFEAPGSPRKTLFETGAISTPVLPAMLFQNHPNPFNPATEIGYYLPARCAVALEVFDVAGRRIARLVQETQDPGQHAVRWGGVDDRGNRVASGIYLYRLTAGKQRLSKKMILLK